MSLQTGSKLLHYEVLGPLGAGAMGEVYRARDSKLGREVAIKVLPEHFADEPERLKRFEREATTLASLNHPNVAQIFGVDQVGDMCFLVLELVPGESLEARLKRGPLTLDEALDVAKQIAEGLEAAHEAGVIHRDLKPANVLITPDGRVKVLDFGLAKTAIESSRGSSTDSVLSTEAGRLLGTPTYMAPEQARGKSIDKRVDIWAFGCVLYECLTAKRAFVGETLTDVLASVIEREPDWTKLPASTPPRVRELLQLCFAKDPRARLRDIGDVRIVLAGAAPEPGAPVSSGRPSPLVLAALVFGLLGIAVGLRSMLARVETSPPPLLRIALRGIAFSGENQAAISPDGMLIVHQGLSPMMPLQVRSLRDFETKPLPGTEGARNPCFSADGQWLAYSTGERLMKVGTAGGRPEVIGNTQPGTVALGSWGDGDLIVYDSGRGYGGEADSLVQLSATGDPSPRLLTKVDAVRGERLHTLPSILPGNHAVLFTTMLKGSSRIEALDLVTHERKVLVEGGADSIFVAPGYLLFWRPPTPALVAVRFDPERLEVHGPEVTVLEAIATGPDMNAKVSVSRNGTLIYGYSREGGAVLSVVRVDRSGRVTPLLDRREAWAEPRFSPDGRRVLLRQIGNPDCNTWSVDLQRSTLTRLTLAGDNHGATWLGSDSFVCSFAGAADAALVRRRADGTGEPNRLIDDPRPFYPRSISADGKLIALSLEAGIDTDIWMLDLRENPVLRQVLATPFREASPAISPDGGWLAYVSNEGGQDEVYLRAYSGPGGKLPVSRHGGGSPVWSRDGSELFFMEGTRMMSAAVQIHPDPQVGTPVELFQGNFGNFRPGNYDVAPDGQSFVMLLASENANEEPELRVVLNWFEELEQKMTAAGDGKR